MVRVLTDKRIKELVGQGKLFKRNTFSQEKCKGTFYYLSLASGECYSLNKSTSFSVSSEKPLVIEPGECVLVQTMEEINFESGEFCGLLFSIITLLHAGVSHTATTIDPGFNKPLVISLINHSNRPQKISPGTEIVKLLILELDESPEALWQPDGWWRSFPGHLKPPIRFDEPRNPEGEATLENLKAIEQTYGPPYDVIYSLLSQITKKIDALSKSRWERGSWLTLVGILAAFIIMLLSFMGGWWISHGGGSLPPPSHP